MKARSLSRTLVAKLAGGAGAALVLFAGLLASQARLPPGATELLRQLGPGSVLKTHPEWVPLSAISSELRTAVLVSEDVAFYGHRGFNFTETAIALSENLRAGHYRRGASTVTQQVARNLFLGREKTLRRKFREAILTWCLEQVLSKDEILEIYLNIVEWGDGISGAEAASRFYFAKSAADLDWAEAALLAAILPNPRRLNPLQAPEEAYRRRHIVLLKLLRHADLTPQEFRQADATPLPRRPRPLT